MWLRPSSKGVQGDLGTSGTGGWRARAVYVGDSPGKPKSLEAAEQAGVGSAAITVVSGKPRDITATGHRLPPRCHSHETCAGDRRTCGSQKPFAEAECEKERNVGGGGGHGDLQGACTLCWCGGRGQWAWQGPWGGPDRGSDRRLGQGREHKNAVLLGAEGGSSLLGTEGGTVPLHALAPCQLVEHLPKERHGELPGLLTATPAVHLWPLGLAS